MQSVLSFLEALLPYGLTCLGYHAVLWSIFRHVLPSSGPWRASPHFTAHQVIALFLMMQWTWTGFFESDDRHLGEIDASNFVHLPSILKPSLFGMKMAQRCIAAMWVWDIPVSMLSQEMSSAIDPLMHAHHIGMLIVACTIMGYLTLGQDTEDYPNAVGAIFAPIFFGQVELSSIPLQIVDLFHPKKSPAWHQYMTARPALMAINGAARLLFAVLFLVVRGIYFPFMALAVVVPNYWEALGWAIKEDQGNKYVLPILLILVFSVLFTMLQMHWAILVANQVYNALNSHK